MDNDYNFYQHAPRDYSLCFKTDCATAGTCLRALAARDLTTDAPNITVINPLLADTAGGTSCAYFRKAEKVRVAYASRRRWHRFLRGKSGPCASKSAGWCAAATTTTSCGERSPSSPPCKRR